jgi:TrpR-related protein YerC/YecD
VFFVGMDAGRACPRRGSEGNLGRREKEGAMPRRRVPVDPRLRDRLADQLWRAILTLRTPEECYRFFEDICTIGEVRAMASRLEVARLLAAGLTYDDIARRTGASSATISRVRRFLEYGADGYRVVLDRLARSRS